MLLRVGWSKQAGPTCPSRGPTRPARGHLPSVHLLWMAPTSSLSTRLRLHHTKALRRRSPLTAMPLLQRAPPPPPLPPPRAARRRQAAPVRRLLHRHLLRLQPQLRRQGALQAGGVGGGAGVREAGQGLGAGGGGLREEVQQWTRSGKAPEAEAGSRHGKERRWSRECSFACIAKLEKVLEPTHEQCCVRGPEWHR